MSFNNRHFFPVYRFRQMTQKDLGWVLKARNHETIRAISGSTAFIGPKEHLNWFISTPDSLKLVFTENNKTLGVLIYDHKQHWSFYLLPTAQHRRGLGRLMLSMFIAIARDLAITLIRARVSVGNYESLSLHENLGFRGVVDNTGLYYDLEKELIYHDKEKR